MTLLQSFSFLGHSLIDSSPAEDLIRPVPFDEIPNFPECDYDKEVTPLFKAIENKRWPVVKHFLLGGCWPGESEPDHKTPSTQVCTWVTKYETSFDGIEERGQWTQLPIHAALVYGAPDDVIKLLLKICPGTVQCGNDQRMVPLHLAFRHGASDAIVGYILDLFPEAIGAKDFRGRTPVECALEGPFSQRGQIIQKIFQRHKDSWKKKQVKLEAKNRIQQEKLSQTSKSLKSKDDEISNLNVSVDLIKWREDQTKKALLTLMSELKDINGWYQQKEKVVTKEAIVEDLSTKLASLQQVAESLIAETERENRQRSIDPKNALFGKINATHSRNLSRADTNDSLGTYSFGTSGTGASFCEDQILMNNHIVFLGSFDSPSNVSESGLVRPPILVSRASFNRNRSYASRTPSFQLRTHPIAEMDESVISESSKEVGEKTQADDTPETALVVEPIAFPSQGISWPCIKVSPITTVEQSKDKLSSSSHPTTTVEQSEDKLPSSAHSSHPSSASSSISSHVPTKEPDLDETSLCMKLPSTTEALSSEGVEPDLDKTISCVKLPSTTEALSSEGESTGSPSYQNLADKAEVTTGAPPPDASNDIFPRAVLPPLHPSTLATKKNSKKARNPFLKTLKKVSSRLFTKEISKKDASRFKNGRTKNASRNGYTSLQMPSGDDVLGKMLSTEAPENTPMHDVHISASYEASIKSAVKEGIITVIDHPVKSDKEEETPVPDFLAITGRWESKDENKNSTVVSRSSSKASKNGAGKDLDDAERTITRNVSNTVSESDGRSNASSKALRSGHEKDESGVDNEKLEEDSVTSQSSLHVSPAENEKDCAVLDGSNEREGAHTEPASDAPADKGVPSSENNFIEEEKDNEDGCGVDEGEAEETESRMQDEKLECKEEIDCEEVTAGVSVSDAENEDEEAAIGSQENMFVEIVDINPSDEDHDDEEDREEEEDREDDEDREEQTTSLTSDLIRAKIEMRDDCEVEIILPAEVDDKSTSDETASQADDDATVSSVVTDLRSTFRGALKKATKTASKIASRTAPMRRGSFKAPLRSASFKTKNPRLVGMNGSVSSPEMMKDPPVKPDLTEAREDSILKSVVIEMVSSKEAPNSEGGALFAL